MLKFVRADQVTDSDGRRCATWLNPACSDLGNSTATFAPRPRGGSDATEKLPSLSAWPNQSRAECRTETLPKPRPPSEREADYIGIGFAHNPKNSQKIKKIRAAFISHKFQKLSDQRRCVGACASSLIGFALIESSYKQRRDRHGVTDINSSQTSVATTRSVTRRWLGRCAAILITAA